MVRVLFFTCLISRWYFLMLRKKNYLILFHLGEAQIEIIKYGIISLIHNGYFSLKVMLYRNSVLSFIQKISNFRFLHIKEIQIFSIKF